MIEKAFLFSYQAHSNQKRKDGKPYMVHPVMTALELARNGADDELICAGLLHDVIEDANVTECELAQSFNDSISALVKKDSENKSLSWEERKNQVLIDVENGDRRFKMLMCADKLSNLNDLYEALEKNGESAWDMFKRGKEKQAWFYKSLLVSLKDIDDTQIYKDFEKLVYNIFEKGEQ